MQPTRRLHPVVAGLIIMAAITMIGAFGSIAFLLTDWFGAGVPGFPATRAPAAAHTVRFEVSGRGTAQISWTVTWDSAVVTDARLPWSKQLVANQPTGLVGITATKPEGSMRCRILVDGRVIADREGTGVVSCDAKVAF